jgi:hypothetical protein
MKIGGSRGEGEQGAVRGKAAEAVAEFLRLKSQRVS